MLTLVMASAVLTEASLSFLAWVIRPLGLRTMLKRAWGQNAVIQLPQSQIVVAAAQQCIVVYWFASICWERPSMTVSALNPERVIRKE